MMKVKAILTLFLIPLVVMGQEPTDYKHWDMFDAYLGKPNEDYGRLGIKEVRRYSVTKEGQKDKWIGQDSFDLMASWCFKKRAMTLLQTM